MSTSHGRFVFSDLYILQLPPMLIYFILFLKCIVERYRQYPTPDAFWARFSEPNGKYMTYTMIVAAIQADREAEHQKVVELAHKEYGNHFDEVFSYKKAGKTHVLSKPCAIYKQYLKLHPDYNADNSSSV
jgi:hypothetical protein